MLGRFIVFALVLYFVVRWANRVVAKSPRPAAVAPKTGRDPYTVLGVSPDTPFDDIRAAYQRLVRLHHPDRVTDMADEIRSLAEERTKEINAAYEALKRKERT